jgi:hypothetical protein
MRPVDEISDPAKLLKFAQEKRLLQFSDGATLADTTSLLYKIALLADKNLPIKAFLDLVRQIQKGEGRRTCFEDEFVLAVSYLDLEISKLGAITYLKGESPDYKETKRNRSLLDTRDESVLKSLSSGLTRPNEDRGSVEMGMIESAHKRMAKLIDLQNAMMDVIKRLEEGATKLDILREVKVGILKEKVTLTDYDTITRMARREGRLKFRNRQKDPDNSYELNVQNHERIKSVADRLGMTPRRALNKVIDDFFTISEKQQQFGGTFGGKASKGVKKGS